MNRFINLVEKYLIRFALAGLLIMVVAQGVMNVDSLRLYLSWGERMEGQLIEFPVSSEIEESESANQTEELGHVQSPQALLILEIEKYSSLPRAAVLINGEKEFVFDEKQLKLELVAGDSIAIDTKAYNYPITFRVGETSDNLAFPVTGDSFTVNQRIAMLGKVIVK